MLKYAHLLYPYYVRRRFDLKSMARFILYFRRNLYNLRKGHIYFVSKLFDIEENTVRDYLQELYLKNYFFEALEQRYISAWPDRFFRPYYFETKFPGGSIFFDAVTMYLLIRAAKPEIVVETGGAMGKSTSFILVALEDNKKGRLITLDLHPESSGRLDTEFSWWPKGKPSVFLVPDYLRHRLDLRQGDTRTTLPEVLKELGRVDFFRHDSDHSYEHMSFEFHTV